MHDFVFNRIEHEISSIYPDFANAPPNMACRDVGPTVVTVDGVDESNGRFSKTTHLSRAWTLVASWLAKYDRASTRIRRRNARYNILHYQHAPPTGVRQMRIPDSSGKPSSHGSSLCEPLAWSTASGI